MGVYALCYVLLKIGLPYSPPLLFGALRIMLGGLALLGLILATKGQLWPRKTPLGWMLFLGFVAMAASTATMFKAGELGSAGLSSVLGNVQPLLTLVFALLILQERISGRKIVAGLVGLVGIGLISLPAFRDSAVGSTEGALLALGSSAVVAFVNIIVKRYVPDVDILSASAWQLLMGSVPLFAASALLEDWTTFNPVPEFIALLLFLGLIGSGFNTFAWYRILKREEVGIVSMYYFVVPAFGLLAAWMAFGEILGLEQWIGVAVICGSLGLVATAGEPKLAAEAS